MKKNENDYIELHLPSILAKKRSISLILVFFLLLLFYGLGLLTMKLHYRDLEEAIANPLKRESFLAKKEMLEWAKKIGLNIGSFTSCLSDKDIQERITKDQKEGAKLGVNSTPTFYINGKVLVGAQPYSVFKSLLEQELHGANGGEKVSVANGALPVRGKSNAKITVIEFSDLQCPFCKRFFLETYPQLKKDYIDTGKAAFYFRHYPLPATTHPRALPYATGAECAENQDKFWQFHDAIFTTSEA